MNSILIRLTLSESFVGFCTFDRTHGGRGRFLISRDLLKRSLEETEHITHYDRDLSSFAEIYNDGQTMMIRFAWLEANPDWELTGFLQTVNFPISWLRSVLEDQADACFLCREPGRSAVIDATHAAATIKAINRNALIRRAFSKAMRDCFNWRDEVITLYNDGGYNFYFTTKSGFPKNGGLILSGGMKDNHPYYRYCVHT